jgi:hypothetical protein
MTKYIYIYIKKKIIIRASRHYLPIDQYFHPTTSLYKPHFASQRINIGDLYVYKITRRNRDLYNLVVSIILYVSNSTLNMKEFFIKFT